MGEVKYTKLFQDKVRGIIRGRFRLEDGKPEFERDEDEDGEELRHYYIILTLEGASPAIDNVTYELLDDSYEGPEPESDEVNQNFRVEITSYGDFPIKVVAVDRSGGAFALRAQLSDLLKDGHPGWKSDPKLSEAIERIEAN